MQMQEYARVGIHALYPVHPPNRRSISLQSPACMSLFESAYSYYTGDLQVNPSWQRSGLGRGLVERLTAQLVSEDITIICLYAEPDVIGLYNRLGFVANPEGIRGMAFQKTTKAGKALAEQAKAVAAETAAASQPAAVAAG